MSVAKCACGKAYRVAEPFRARTFACRHCGATIQYRPPNLHVPRASFALWGLLGAGSLAAIAAAVYFLVPLMTGEAEPPTEGTPSESPEQTAEPSRQPGESPDREPQPRPDPPAPRATLLVRVHFDPADPTRAAFIPGYEVIRPGLRGPVATGGFDAQAPNAMMWTLAWSGAREPVTLYLPARVVATRRGDGGIERVDLQVSRFGSQQPLRIPMRTPADGALALAFAGATPGTLDALRAQLDEYGAAPGRAEVEAALARLSATDATPAAMQVALSMRVPFEDADAMRTIVHDAFRGATALFDAAGRPAPALDPVPRGFTWNGRIETEEGSIAAIRAGVEERSRYVDLEVLLRERRVPCRPAADLSGTFESEARVVPPDAARDVLALAREVLVLDGSGAILGVAADPTRLAAVLISADEADRRVGPVPPPRLSRVLGAGLAVRIRGRDEMLTPAQWLASEGWETAGDRYRLAWLGGGLQGGPTAGDWELIRLRIERADGSLVDTGWRLSRYGW